MNYYISDREFPLNDYTRVKNIEDLLKTPRKTEIYIVGRIPLHMDKPEFWELVRVRENTLRRIR